MLRKCRVYSWLPALLLALLVSSCGSGDSGSVAGSPPTATTPDAPAAPAVTTEPATAPSDPVPLPEPTIGQPSPTSEPITAPRPSPTSEPTATPQPLIAFDPQQGMPGTVVQVSGWNFAPGEPVVVRLGLPQPVGEALASAFADGQGSWSAEVIIPDRLPSGEIIVDQEMRLVAMNDQNIALASAPFDFIEPARALPVAPQQVVRDFMAAWSAGEDVLGYLAADQRREAGQGRPVHALLGLHPIQLNQYMVHEPPQIAEIALVDVTLAYVDFGEVRRFMLASEDGQWRITSTILVQQPASAEAVQVVRDALEAFFQQGDVKPYLSANLRDQAEQGQPIDVLLGLQLAELNSYTVHDQPRLAAVAAVDVTFEYTGSTLVRRYMLENESGTWRIYDSIALDHPMAQ